MSDIDLGFASNGTDWNSWKAEEDVFDLTAYLQKSEVPVRIFRLSSSD
jgi:hypothetical protein